MQEIAKRNLPGMATRTSLNRIFLWSLVFLLFSCQDNIVKQKTLDFDQNYWHKDSIVKIEFTPKLNQKYTISFLLRNDNNYPYSNIFLIGSIENNKIKKVDTLEYEMADEQGKWLGTGAGEIKESKLVYKKNYRFTDSLPYIISVKHAVRKTGNIEGDSLLKGITNVGIIIEKTE